MQYKVRTHVNPLNVACLIMVAITMIMTGIIMVAVLTSNRVHYDMDTDGVVRQYSTVAHTCIDESHTYCDGDCECDGMQCPPIPVTYTYRDMKEYQVDVVPGYTIWYDQGQAQFVVPMDRGCNLTKAVEKDNQ